MKKWIALLLVLVMALSLTACGEKERYPEIADLLDAGDYEGAVQKIVELYQASQNGGSQATQTPGGTQPAVPTEEERNQLYEYRTILRNLNSYLEDGSISVYDDETQISYDGTWALEYYYNKLQNLTAVDKWAGTDYVANNISNADEVSWDRQAVLAAFTILKDIKLKTTVSSKDNMGNQNDPSTIGRWYYDTNGVLTEMYDGRYEDIVTAWTNSSRCYFTYDDSGRITQKRYGSADRVDMLVTYTYDDGANTVTEHVKTNSNERDYIYTYDNAGLLTQVEWNNGENNRYVITYTYDAGRLVREEKINYYYSSGYELEYKNQTWIMEYAYNAAGVLTAGTYTEEDWSIDSEYQGNGQYTYTEYMYRQKIDQYTYTCDAQGRVVKETIIPGNEVGTYGDDTGEIYSKPSYQSKDYETIYGDYYIYAPAQQ